MFTQRIIHGLTPSIITGLVCLTLQTNPAMAANEYTSEYTGAYLHQTIEQNSAPVILDVRSTEEFNEGHIEGAQHVPFDTVKAHLKQLPTDRNQAIVVYCHSGGRAEDAMDTLRALGFTNVSELKGHYRAWKKENRPLVTPASEHR